MGTVLNNNNSGQNFYKRLDNFELTSELFKNPTSEYKAAPFWSWNGKLEKNELLRQISVLKEMGFGGFHMHVREGLSTKYLGDEFMDLIKSCVRKAKSEGMLAYLYDEDRWPSGFAGGYVTKDVKLRQKKLIFSPARPKNAVDASVGVNSGEDYIVGCYDINLNSDFTIDKYTRIDDNDTAENEKWYAYITTTEPTSWYNNQTYVDTLNKEATEKFIDITHESYKNAVGDEFGKIVPSIFTDEPHYASVKFFEHANDKKEVSIPWTSNLTETFKNMHGYDVLDCLPEIFWEQNSSDTSVRYAYHKCISEMFRNNYIKPISDWCKMNSISLLGHVLQEDRLSFQTDGVGEAMKLYPYFGIPGVDLLFNGIGYNTMKQAQSVSHQYDRGGVLSELYGVTGWHFDFRGHKFQGDWQAALGVTLRVHHHAWVTMKGNAKRDYPASINYHSPWHKEYSYIENHYSRLAAALTRGRAVVNIGVIHPIESMWTAWGPADVCKEVKDRLDSNHEKVTEWIIFSGLDFDFISEALLCEDGGVDNDKLVMKTMEYSTIIVSGNITMRQSTIDLLKQYLDNGGKLIFMGDCPSKVDGKPSDEARDLYNKSIKIPFEKTALINELEGERFVEITNENGIRNDNLIHTLRKDNDDYWVFFANGKKIDINGENLNFERITFTFNGEFTPIMYDTLTGETVRPPYEVKDGKTVVIRDMYVNDSLLIRLMTFNGVCIAEKCVKDIPSETLISDSTVECIREEENVYLIDMADYKINDGDYNGKPEEFRRIDTAVREKLSLFEGGQPWIYEESESVENYVTYKFDVVSESDINAAYLCAEDITELSVNGRFVKLIEAGYFVDLSIKKYKLPLIKSGTNQFVVKVPIAGRVTLENMFITGDFGVEVDGFNKKLIPSCDKISFGDITSQSMPFYGGNIVYRVNIKTPKCKKLNITVPKYKGSLIGVKIDGKDAGGIVFAPNKLTIENVDAGSHTVEFKLYGNRANTFGPLHLANPNYINLSPKSYYTTGSDWSYEYNLKETGIMEPPQFEFIK